MNFIEYFIQGLISGFGMVIVMTVFSLITFLLTKKFITKQIRKIWNDVRGHVDMTGSIDFQKDHEDWKPQEDITIGGKTK